MTMTKGKVLINFEVTPKQREYIKHIASLHGLSMADYIRMHALRPIEKEES